MKTFINLLIIILALTASVSCNGMVIPPIMDNAGIGGQEKRKNPSTCIEILGVTGETCQRRTETQTVISERTPTQSETSVALPEARHGKLSENDLSEIRILAELSNKELLAEIETLLPELSPEEQITYATRIKEIGASQPLKAQALVDRSTSLQEACMEYAELTGEYVYKSGCQVVLGNYTDETNTLGTIGQFSLGLSGLDVVADLRDLSHDLLNPEFSWSWAGKTALDGIGLIPVVGAIKYADKVGDLVKGVSKSSKVLDTGRTTLKHSNQAANIAEIGAKSSKRAVEAATDRPFRYRGDSRSADEIFRDGFKPRGTSDDILLHAKDNMSPPSAYVSTSKYGGVAYGFNDNVYVVRPKGGIDINKTLGKDSPFYDEFEVAVRGAIAPEDVRALTLPEKGLSILNPNYRP